jgi:cytochrome c5
VTRAILWRAYWLARAEEYEATAEAHDATARASAAESRAHLISAQLAYDPYDPVYGSLCRGCAFACAEHAESSRERAEYHRRQARATREWTDGESGK